MAAGIAASAMLFHAAPAAAAYPECNSVTRLYVSGAYTDRPAFIANGVRTTDCVLRRGSAGRAVEILQIALLYCNIPDPGPLDGVYGTRTENAIRWIQWASGIHQDGVYGPKTRDVMGWVYHDGTQGKCS